VTKFVTLIIIVREAQNCYTGWPQKSKPLPNDRKIVLNRTKACE